MVRQTIRMEMVKGQPKKNEQKTSITSKSIHIYRYCMTYDFIKMDSCITKLKQMNAFCCHAHSFQFSPIICSLSSMLTFTRLFWVNFLGTNVFFAFFAIHSSIRLVSTFIAHFRIFHFQNEQAYNKIKGRRVNLEQQQRQR